MVIVITLVSLLRTIKVLKPGFSLIFISDFLAPLSICISFATFLTSSSACLRSKSSEKFSKRASIISIPL